MKEIKEIIDIINILDDLFFELGYEELTAFLGTDFAYYGRDKEISFTFLTLDWADEGFLLYLNHTFPDLPQVSLLMYSILHEIGHHITYHKGKKRYLRYKKAVKAIKLKKKESKAEKVQRQIKYCSIPDEAMATKAGMNILYCYTDLIKEYDKKLTTAYKKFYKNNLTLD